MSKRLRKTRPKNKTSRPKTAQNVINRLATRQAPNCLATWMSDLDEWLGMVDDPILTPQDMDVGKGRNHYIIEYANGLLERVKACWCFTVGYPDDLRAKVKATLSPLTKALNDILMNDDRDMDKAKLMKMDYADMVLNRLRALHREHGPVIHNLADAAMDHDLSYGQPDLPAGLDGLNRDLTLARLAKMLEHPPTPRAWTRWMPLNEVARILDMDHRTLRKSKIPWERRHDAARQWRFDIHKIERQFGKRIANKMRENTKQTDISPV